MRRFRTIFAGAFIIGLLFPLSGAPPIKDKIFNYDLKKPCWLDKYRIFCCPVKKIVRRYTKENKWVDYCYNDREELIGLRRYDGAGTVHSATHIVLSNCTHCAQKPIAVRKWKHDTNPKLAPAKSKKKRK